MCLLPPKSYKVFISWVQCRQNKHMVRFRKWQVMLGFNVNSSLQGESHVTLYPSCHFLGLESTSLYMMCSSHVKLILMASQRSLLEPCASGCDAKGRDQTSISDELGMRTGAKLNYCWKRAEKWSLNGGVLFRSINISSQFLRYV